MKNKLLCLAFVVGVLTFCGPTFAHHGSAAYSSSVAVMKDATVTRFTWNNPHCIVMFDVKDEKGNVVHWTAETASPEALKLIGWSKSSLGPGDVISVYLYAAKTGNPAGRLNKVVLSDGSVLHDTQLGGDAGGKSGYGPDAGGNRGNGNGAK